MNKVWSEQKRAFQTKGDVNSGRAEHHITVRKFRPRAVCICVHFCGLKRLIRINLVQINHGS